MQRLPALLEVLAAAIQPWQDTICSSLRRPAIARGGLLSALQAPNGAKLALHCLFLSCMVLGCWCWHLHCHKCPTDSTQCCCRRGTGAGTQAHLPGQRPHDCEGGHVQRHPRASRQLDLVDLVAAANDIAGATAGLDNDCRQAGCVSEHPDPELQAPLRQLCSGRTCSRLPASRGSLAFAGCAAGCICAAECRQTGHRRQ